MPSEDQKSEASTYIGSEVPGAFPAGNRHLYEVDEEKRVPDSEEAVHHPRHYTSDPSGVEAITICEHRTFCIGNALKYIFRAGLKGGRDKHIEDLKKAIWYLQREIDRLVR